MFAKKSLFRNQFLNHALVFCVIFVMSGFGILFADVEIVRAANTCTSNQDGEWSTAGNWSNCGGTTPQAGDTVEISHSISIGDFVINEVYDIEIKSGGTLTFNNARPQVISHRLTIRSGGLLTHGDNASSLIYKIDLTATEMVVDSGGSINVDEKGFDGGTNQGSGYGPGGGSRSGAGAGGGAHCGDGGSENDSPGGTAYCEISNPLTLGSGGADWQDYNGAPCDNNICDGGSGGGLIKLTLTDSIIINGTVTADGEDGDTNYLAAGAGGTINISAGTIAGTPESMTVAGGSKTGSFGNGGGGGGGIIYFYTDSYTINPSTSGVDITAGSGGTTGAGVGVFNWEKVNPDSVGSTCTSLGDGHWDRIAWDCGRMPLATDDVVINHSVELDTDFIIPVLADLTINASKTLTQSNSSTQTIAGDLNIYGTLTHTAHTPSDGNAVINAVNCSADNITVHSSGVVTADEKGHSGGTSMSSGYGPGGGLRSGTKTGGGAHCGDGGSEGDAAGGTAYCSTSTPFTMGSGGADAQDFDGSPCDNNICDGGSGGGLIILVAASTITIEGVITANGEDGDTNYLAAGAGGTINISANTVTGTPNGLTVAGGSENGLYSNGGGGGGGLIYISHTSPLYITSSTANVDLSPGLAGTDPVDDVGIFWSVVVEGGGGGGGGGGVPEFSTLIYLTTIIFAFGALYKSQKRFNFTNVRIP